MNIVFDIINLVFTAWLKPMLAMALLIYVVNKPDFRSAATNHWLLFLAILSPLVFIVFFSSLPRIEFAVLPSFLAEFTTTQVFQPARSLFDAPNVYSVFLLAVYLAGVLVFLGKIVFALRDTLKLIARSDIVDDELVLGHCDDLRKIFSVAASIRVVCSAEISAPLMFGFVRPCILLPQHFQAWGEARLRRVLAHEIAHIERRDCFYKLCGEVLCAFFWFNPLIWKAHKQGAWFAELACDDLVVSKLQCRAEYASDLLEISTDACHHKLAALSFIKKSELYLRINAILDSGKNRKALDCLSRTFLFSLVLLMLLPVSVLEARQTHYKSLSELELEALQAQTRVKVQDLILIEPQDGKERDDWSLAIDGYVKLEVLQERYKRQSRSTHVPQKQTSQQHTQLAALNYHAQKPVEESMAIQSRPRLDSLEVQAHQPLEIVTPYYPRRALQKNLEATVVVSFDLDLQGKVLNPRIVSVDHNKVFNRPVLKAISESRYKPMTVNGRAIITRNVKETFIFTLKDTADTH